MRGSKGLSIFSGWLFCYFVFFAGSAAAASYFGENGDRQVPDVLVSWEAGTTEYAVVVEKQKQKIYLFRLDGSVEQVFEFKTSTGEVAGPKARSGDKRTPEGIYFFVREHPQRDLSPTYGSRAFPMDYPNLLDRIAGRDGNAIWMHGTNKPLKPRDSNGCVVLQNQDIDRLAKYITLNRTPIIVVDKLSYTSVESISTTRAAILGFVSKWRQSLEGGTYHQYLKYYDDDYLPKISWWPDWNRLKKNRTVSSGGLAVDLRNIMILRHQDMYVVLFDQVVQASGKEFSAGTRKLFLAAKNGHFSIIGDSYQVLPEERKGIQPGNPMVVAARELAKTPRVAVKEEKKQKKKSAPKNQDIQDMVNGWAKAWSSKDIKVYGGYYAKNFRSQGGADLDAWLKYKQGINRRYKYIRVTVRSLSISRGKTRSVATFVQKYESSAFKTTGSKKLILIRENGQWKIYREIWKKS